MNFRIETKNKQTRFGQQAAARVSQNVSLSQAHKLNLGIAGSLSIVSNNLTMLLVAKILQKHPLVAILCTHCPGIKIHCTFLRKKKREKKTSPT